MKTNKSYSKRVRVTKNGKLVARKPGQDHYNALETGKKQGAKRRAQSLQVPNAIRRRFLSY
jgi:ribosomal protein L35